MRHLFIQLTHVAALTLVAALLASGGCAKPASTREPLVTFDRPEDAVAALVAAVEKHDRTELTRLLGAGSEPLLSSGDPVADSTEREAFLVRYRAKNSLVAGSLDDVVLQVGEDDWPLPIPIVRRNGRWHLDGAAGADEIVMRRIGANELRTIDVMHGFVAAEQDYAADPHDGGTAGAYAQLLRSESGKHNGLYWKVAQGEPQSPAGPMLAAASAEGYSGAQERGEPYHGYHFRMLTSQGPAAMGGARDYLMNGRLTGGFALLAWPASYGASGVMTFMVNQDGIVWQRDLGFETADLAAAIKTFDPDSTWLPIAPEQ